MNSEEYLFTLVESIQQKEAEFGFVKLSPREQVFFCVWSLEAELNNGEFDQYFFNSAGDHAAETVAALRTIGAEHTATLVKRAIEVFGSDGPDSDWNARQDQVLRLSDIQEKTLDELDNAFYSYEDILSDLLALYMKAL